MPAYWPTARVQAAVMAFVAVVISMAIAAAGPALLSSRSVAIWTWSSMRRLPKMPILLHGSPMQKWWKAHGSSWDVATISTLATTTLAGEYNVSLQFQDKAVGPSFLPYKGLRGDGVTEPRFRVDVTSLSEAVSRLWGHTMPDASSDFHYYLSVSIEDLPPSIAEAVFEFLPQGCIRDDRWFGGTDGVWSDSDANAHCRGLTANMWFGAAGKSAAAHFDLSHNIFFLAAGTKVFRLLPPSAHRTVGVHPSWHGSHLAAQASLSDAQFASLGGVTATLTAGDVLYLPPGWFHEVSSVSDNVGINLWTHSLATDTWHHLNGDAAQWDALLTEHINCISGGLAPLLQCARACLLVLHAELHAQLNADMQSAQSTYLTFLSTTGTYLYSLAPSYVALSSAQTTQHVSMHAVARGKLAEQAALLVATRYATRAWQAELPKFRTPLAAAARERVAGHCDALLRSAAASTEDSTDAVLVDSQRQLIHGYAHALARIEEGLRSLLLDEFVDEFSRYVVGPAAEAATVATGETEASPGDTAVETFISRCLAAGS